MRKLIILLAASVAFAAPPITVADAKVRAPKIECKDMSFMQRLQNRRTCQNDSDRSRARPCGAPVEGLPVILINGGPEGPGKPEKPEKPEKPDRPDKPEKPEPPKPEKPTPSRPDKPSKSKPC